MGSYNLQVYDYEGFTQYRVYKRPVITDRKIENKNENIISEDKRKEHSQRVSINRTIQSIYELSYNNKWEYFITLTFDRENTDAKNYDEIIRKMQNYLHNIQKRKCGKEFKYLMIPERHKDGSFHLHGLFANCGELEFIESGRVMINGKAYKKTKNNSCYPVIYNIPSWKWGFSTATRVLDNAKTCSYMTKYITKDLCIAIKNKRRFYPSRNLKRVEVQQYNIDILEIDEMIMSFYAQGLVDYEKTQIIEEAGQIIRYITIKKEV